MRILIHLFLIVFLTILTQIGGIIYLIAILLIKKSAERRRVKRIGIFVSLYLISTFIVVPYLAPIFGREKIKETNLIETHTFFTVLANRNYVRPELNSVLAKTSINLNLKYQGIKVVYLDANFPFINKFPLLPHLSHNDGKKLDLSLVYKDENGKITNKKPSISGYGVYAEPTTKEHDQAEICKKKGYWQYDFPKYLTFGKINKEISLSETATRDLINEIVKQPQIGKIFIEPHLKSRLNLTNVKFRFHGCGAVRHDDHIHIQLR